ncbi:MAG TPA: hypothetical protein VNX01_03360 [Bacteroidia bacterium]|nr:hypothetical protein [Bacteroidia bacterium]
MTTWKEWETNDGQKHKQEVIKDWSKRDDHRHHAIDALAIACTEQGFIQRINNLSSQGNRDEMYKEVEKRRPNLSLLDNYLIAKRPFSTKEIEAKASEILISFKAGKKVATLGKRKIKKNGKQHIVQENIIIPRGSLSEESVYGKIKTIEKDFKTDTIVKHPLKYLFENPCLIFKPSIKKLIEERLAAHENDSKKALASLINEPIYLDAEKIKILEYGSCYKEEYVIKYPLESIKAKDADYILDEKVKELVKARLEKFGNKEKEAFKETLWFNEEKKIPIKTVRMLTGLSSVEPVKKNEAGKEIGFVKPGNNHHIVFYIDENGKKVEHSCTFWHAVERKKYDLPVIIKNPKEVWDKILVQKDNYPQTFLQKLPNDKWFYSESLQQNEMFILGLNPEISQEAIKTNDKKLLNQHLYRVQKIAESNYMFRHHLETQINDSNEAKISLRFQHIRSIGAFEKLNPIKVRVNNLGEIIE